MVSASHRFKGQDLQEWINTNIYFNGGRYEKSNFFANMNDPKYIDEMIDLMDDMVGNVTTREAYDAAVVNSITNNTNIRFQSSKEITKDAPGAIAYHSPGSLVSRREFNKNNWHLNNQMSPTAGGSITHPNRLGGTTLIHEIKHQIQLDLTNVLTPGFHIFNIQNKIHTGYIPSVITGYRPGAALISESRKRILGIPVGPKKYYKVNLKNFYRNLQGERYLLSPQGMSTAFQVQNKRYVSVNIGGSSRTMEKKAY